MSNKTPTKSHSASKKTPAKSTSKKQESHLITNPTKQTPKSTKKSLNFIDQIKKQFAQSHVVDVTLSHKEVSHELKRILSVQGVQVAVEQLVSFIMAHNLPQTTLHSSLSQLNNQNINALVYLIQQVISNLQTRIKVQLPLRAWIHSIWTTNPELVSYNQVIKQSVNKLSQKHSQNNEIDIIKGKIALISRV